MKNSWLVLTFVFFISQPLTADEDSVWGEQEPAAKEEVLFEEKSIQEQSNISNAEEEQLDDID